MVDGIGTGQRDRDPDKNRGQDWGVDWLGPEGQSIVEEGGEERGWEGHGARPEEASNTQTTFCEPSWHLLWDRDSCLSAPWTSVPPQDCHCAEDQECWLENSTPSSQHQEARRGAQLVPLHQVPKLEETQSWWHWQIRPLTLAVLPGREVTALAVQPAAWEAGLQLLQKHPWPPAFCDSLLKGALLARGPEASPAPKGPPQDPLVVPFQAQQPQGLGVDIRALAGDRRAPSPDPTPAPLRNQVFSLSHLRCFLSGPVPSTRPTETISLLLQAPEAGTGPASCCVA